MAMSLPRFPWPTTNRDGETMYTSYIKSTLAKIYAPSFSLTTEVVGKASATIYLHCGIIIAMVLTQAFTIWLFAVYPSVCHLR